MRRGNSWATAAILLASAIPVAAQDQPIDARVNYVYASQFGFGRYSIGGLDVAVYSLPLEFHFENAIGNADLRLGTPIVYGSYSFEGSGVEQGMPTTAKIESNSLAVQPELTLDIPLYEGLRLSPLISWGIGFTFGSSADLTVGSMQQSVDTSETALYTYEVGVSALYERPLGAFRILYGMAFVWAGDSTLGNAETDTEDYGTFYTGPEVRHPLGFHIGDVTPDAGLFFVYHYFAPDLQFTRAGREALEVQQIFEFGLSFGSATPMNLAIVGDLLDRFRIGASYQTATDFNAFRINFGFPF